MSATGVGKICFLKWLINITVYRDVLDHFPLSYREDKLETMNSSFSMNLQSLQKNLFTEKRIPVLVSSANSPDENPIENTWIILKRKFKKYCLSNPEKWKWVISESWKSMSPETYSDLIGSLPERK